MSAGSWIALAVIVLAIAQQWALVRAWEQRDKALEKVEFLDQCIQDHLKTINGLYRDSNDRARRAFGLEAS